MAADATGAFDASLLDDLRVDVVPVDDGGEVLGDPVVSFSSGSTGKGSERLRVDSVDEHYHVNFHTGNFGLAAGALCRIVVLRASDEAQYGCVEISLTGKQKGGKVAPETGGVSVKLGRTLPIKFWIEEGAEPVLTGGKILFVSDRDGNQEIYCMNPDGSDQTRLTYSSGPDWNPTWSRDGQTIAFVSNRDGNAEIYRMNADGSGQTRLTFDPNPDFNPAISPDGTQIAFARVVNHNNDIYLMGIDGANQRRIKATPTNDWAPSWSPDGLRLVFQRDYPRGMRPNICVMDADGSDEAELTASRRDWNPVWSPDGMRIAFNSQRDGNDEVYVMDASGDGETNLTNHPARDGGPPSWSPDGSQVVFHSDRDGNREIYVMGADGGSPTPLTNHPANDQEPCWWPR